MRRLTILLAAVGALLLLPASQALANGFLSVNIEGTGKGEISSVGGFELGGFEGSPPLTCSYDGTSTSGECESELEINEEFELEGVAMHPVAAHGSEFVGWTFNQGAGNGWPAFDAFCKNYIADGDTECLANQATGTGTNIEVTAVFNKKLVTGPTNLRTLTLKVSPDPSSGAGQGSVSSKPKGIKCAGTCTEAVASMYEGTPVELTAKASTGSTFKEWKGACSGSSSICTVPMKEAESVEAVFTGTSKPFSPAEELVFSKEGTGKGTVKASGLTCEAECTSTTALYQGPITGAKPKPGKVVILKQAAAFGSTFIGWSGCKVLSETECEVKMEAAEAVSAEYEALPSKTLTINKPYASGNGSVSSSPKGIKCGTTCTQAVAQMPEGTPVTLTAKPTAGSFVEWLGGDCGGSTSTTCVATMNTNESIQAVFSEPGKAIVSEKTLVLNKVGSGLGTVKASGLACEVLCSSTSVLYQGPITGAKPKPGKVVILKALSAPGTATVEWSGCKVLTATECEVKMEAKEEVTATFNELE